MKTNNTPVIFSLLLIFCLAFSFVQVQAQVGTQLPLNPKNVPQFVDPLPHFAGLRVNAKAGGNLTVEMVPHSQIAVSTGTVLAGGVVDPVNNPDFGKANVWAYQISDLTGGNFTAPLWPAFTIEARRGYGLNVTYYNNLYGEAYSNVGLIVDQTLHWAAPTGFDGTNPPAVAHLHGGEVPPWSDGGPDSWFTPGFGQTGHAYVTNQYSYPNTQEAATLWFHDHALGATRLNVYAGLAAFYFLRGDDEEDAHLPGWSGDDLVQEAAGGFNATPYLPEIEIVIQDRMFDTDGKLYFPTGIPGGAPNPDIHPQWIPEFVGDIITVNGKTWPYLSVAPRKYRFRFLNGSNARFYEMWLQDLVTKTMGPVIWQIGTDGGLLNTPVPIDPVLGGKLVMGPGERADVIIDFTDLTGTTWTLRNSGHTPFPKGPPPNGATIGRIMQFVVNGSMVDGPDDDTDAGDNSQLAASLRPTSGNLVQLTDFMGDPMPDVPIAKVRQLTLNEVMGPGGPLEVLVNNTKWAGHGIDANGDMFIRDDFKSVPNDPDQEDPDPFEDITYYSETVQEGETEIWQIINITADAHPIHLHLVQFQLMSRQNFNVNKYVKAYDGLFPGGAFIGGYGPPKPYDFYATAPNIPALGPIYGGNPDVRPYFQGPVKPANLNERGWKDTFIMYPGEVTTVIARWAPTDKLATADPTDPDNEMWFAFDPSGAHGYVWHCHIIDHEDNEMMRPYDVMPNPVGPWAPEPDMPLAKKGVTEEEPIAAAELPATFELSQNHPNPFNPTTEIKFSLPEASHVTLKLYNSLGQEVATLIDADAQAGYHIVKLDAKDLASGVYIYTIEAGKFSKTLKMMLLR
jgi:spore coat protein A